MPRHNTGSVFQRKDGFWVMQATVQGKRITKYANSKEAAEQMRLDLFPTISDRVIEPKAPIVPTLAEFLPQYLGATDHKITTRNNIEYCFKTYIFPNMENKALTEIIPLDLVNLIRKLKDKELSGTTIKTIYCWLKTVLNTACQWELITSNPAAKVKIPKKDTQPKAVWTVKQTHQFLAYCQTNPLRWEPLFLFVLSTGLRVGELLGLEWSDINFDKKTLKVQRNLIELPEAKRLIQTPKSKSSIRTISLSQHVFDTLHVLEPDHAKHTGAVFKNIDGTHPRRATIFLSLKRTCRRAGVPEMSIHGLRHQHLSLLAHAGVPVKAAQARAGHATAQMTLNVYLHVLDEDDSATVTALDALLAKGGVK